MVKQLVVPHLWFDKEAIEAAKFYSHVFPNSKVVNTSVIKNTLSGDCDTVTFEVMGFRFEAISAGPMFAKNPSISFMVNFDPSYDKGAKENIDTVWNELVKGGKVLMELQEYPWSKRYGWVEDKYGVSWQLILTDPEGEDRPLILPSLLFTNARSGLAEEAVKFYASVFKESKVANIVHFEEDMGPNKKGTVMFSDFKLGNVWLTAADGGDVHNFGFNEGISLIIQCDTQEEIDYYWEKLSAVPESEQCGWVKDKYGVSWQIIPTNWETLMVKNPAKVTAAMLKMKKLVISDLEDAARTQ